MIEGSQSENCAITILQRQGDQSKFDIGEIFGELAHSQRVGKPFLLLFEWSQVGSWPFEAPGADAIRDWKQTAPLISRAALVHTRRLTRHAAILAPLMRVRDVEVRSFYPPKHERAADWLAAGLQPSTSEGRRPHGDQECS
jgi:hypothetical protein